MMTALTDQFIDESHGDVLQISNSNAGIDATLRTVSDGKATDSKLQLSTAQVNINDTPGDHSAAPSLSFGDANTGLYESADNTLRIAIGGVNTWLIGSTIIGASDGSAGGYLRAVAPSSTVATLNPAGNDTDTGLGHAAADQLSLIAGGVEGIRISEDTTITINAYGNIYPGTDNSYYLGKNDDDTPFAWKGIILKDQGGTGKYYRLEVSGDAIQITDLTD